MVMGDFGKVSKELDKAEMGCHDGNCVGKCIQYASHGKMNHSSKGASQRQKRLIVA